MSTKSPVFSSKLQNHCVKTLSPYDCFQDRQHVINLFSIDDLVSYVNEIPDASNSKDRVENCLLLLLRKRKNKGGKWLIIIFFEHLLERYKDDETAKTDLEKLRREAQQELSNKYDTVQESEELKKFMASTSGAESEAKQKSLEEEAAKWVSNWNDDAQDWAWHIALAFFDGVYYDTLLEIRQKIAATLETHFTVAEEKSKEPSEVTKPKSKKKSRRKTEDEDEDEDNDENEDEDEADAIVPATSPKPRLKIADMQAELDRVDAENAEIWVNDEDEEAGIIEIVRLKNTKLSQYAAQLIWRKYPDLHDLLVILLLEYAMHPSTLIRNRVARTVGFIAKTSFASIERKILGPWANLALSNSWPILRTVISRVFAILIVDEKRQTLAKGLLKEWVNSNNTALRWAALRAYIYVGLTFPRDAIEQWRKVTEQEPHLEILDIEIEDMVLRFTNVTPIFQSLQEAIITFLFSLSHERHKAAEVLQALGKWASATGPIGNLGLFYFLVSTNVEANTDEAATDAETTLQLPLLLCLVNPEDSISGYRPALAGLFCQALLGRDSEAAALVALNSWVVYVDSSTKEKTLHKNMIKTVYLDILASPSKEATRATLKRKLLYHLEIWANRRRSKNSETAQWLLGQLK